MERRAASAEAPRSSALWVALQGSLGQGFRRVLETAGQVVESTFVTFPWSVISVKAPHGQPFEAQTAPATELRPPVPSRKAPGSPALGLLSGGGTKGLPTASPGRGRLPLGDLERSLPGVLPVGSGELPVGSRVLRVGSGVLPVGSGVLPVGSDVQGGCGGGEHTPGPGLRLLRDCGPAEPTHSQRLGRVQSTCTHLVENVYRSHRAEQCRDRSRGNSSPWC
ncbi:hypothetical protein CB1_000709013 [Camelus ferus]|nr:hypothetical protein CB1_000709013 [Camelus ferus]